MDPEAPPPPEVNKSIKLRPGLMNEIELVMAQKEIKSFSDFARRAFRKELDRHWEKQNALKGAEAAAPYTAKTNAVSPQNNRLNT